MRHWLNEGAGQTSVLFLKGDLGVGKTTFVKELLTSFGYNPGNVQSPTFLKLIEHEVPELGQVLHIDAYRIEDEEAALALGLESYEEAKLVVVEWPKNIKKFLGKHTLLAHLWDLKNVGKLKIRLSKKDPSKRKTNFDIEEL